MPLKARAEERPKPFPHYLVYSQKHIHGWYKTKARACTSERLLLNPYNGCGVGCFYCYSRSFWGYFLRFQREGKVFVFSDFDKIVENDLAKSQIAFCGYLSPVTDPLQTINDTYRLSEKTIDVFLRFGLPVNVTTKRKVPLSIISRLKQHPHSYLQVSLLTLDEKLQRLLAPQGARVSELLASMKKASDKGVFVVARLDPILPYVNDDFKVLEKLIKTVKNCGARHVIASVLDIPYNLRNFVGKKIKQYFGRQIYAKYQELYCERLSGLNAKSSYRRRIFSFLSRLCRSHSLTFALCREFEKKAGKWNNLNQEFSTSLNCEGVNIPLYYRRGKKFLPLENCQGNCLTCTTYACGIKELVSLSQNKPLGLKYSHYRRLRPQNFSPREGGFEKRVLL